MHVQNSTVGVLMHTSQLIGIVMSFENVFVTGECRSNAAAIENKRRHLLEFRSWVRKVQELNSGL